MASIGVYHTLKVLRETGSGYYLDAGALGEILLPGNVAPKDLPWGSEIEVFIYPDSEDRLVATTQRPRATVGQFACLEVVDRHPRIGVFLDWGLPKDLLLPFREQGDPLEIGERVVVYLKYDERSERIIATTKWNRFLSKGHPPYKSGQPVSFLLTHATPLGYHAIVAGRYSGLLYHSSLGRRLEIGQTMAGYIQAVRPDGKIDLSLDPPGPARVDDLAAAILEALRQNGGRLEFDDNSAPEAIRATFNTSKKAFKKALGGLYKQRKIRFSDGGGIEQG